MTPTERIRKILTLCEASAIYEQLILLGKEALPYPDNFKTPDRLIEGCQSELYLMSELKEGRLYFRCASEALISKGIACFATGLVDGLTPEEVLHYPFEEIRALKLPMILSPSRSSGLASVLKKIKMLALSELLRSKESPNS